jgi:AcrR family transcriptional regulator
MPRNAETVHRRLQAAAMELFLARGYEQTTAGAIAALAGVTERTFYRHFADKRETLFGGEAAMKAILVDAIVAAPADLAPMQVLARAFGAVEGLLAENVAFAAMRQTIIDTTPALQERQLSKAASLIALVAGELEKRGAPARSAALAAQAGMAVFDQAARAWSADPARPFAAHIAEALDDLQQLSAGPAR